MSSLTKADFTKKYPTGKKKEQYNKAIRAEIPGGNGLLDLLTFIHQSRRGKITDPLELLAGIEDRIMDIRDDAVAAIQEKYNLLKSES